MIFFYQKVNSKVYRPLVSILLRSDTKFMIYLALIDSGADYCVFNREVARALDVRLSNETINIKGIAPKEIRGRVGFVKIRIGKVSYRLRAVFAPISNYGYGILGGRGFFDHFDVKLSYRKRVIEIQPASRVS